MVGSVVLFTVQICTLKFDAPSWQTAMLTEPGLFGCLGDFMALSMWREEGGYDQAGKTMEAELLKWEGKTCEDKSSEDKSSEDKTCEDKKCEDKTRSPPSGLAKQEVLRRKVVVGKFFVDCGKYNYCASSVFSSFLPHG